MGPCVLCSDAVVVHPEDRSHHAVRDVAAQQILKEDSHEQIAEGGQSS
jgi:hypothetical protein